MKNAFNLGRCDLGPIRPPSESFSLLIRATRNCPWNNCLFCPVYKGTRFQKRAAHDVIAEIDLLADAANAVRRRVGIGKDTCEISEGAFTGIAHDHTCSYDMRRVALWMHRGGRHVFLQDADSLVRPAEETARVIDHLKRRFPLVDRITSYARSRTLVAKTPEQLETLRLAGLTRVHVGLESGCDEVLAYVNKGCRAEHHINGLRRTRNAGLEVCCYVMPGLGGRALSSIHAEETARVLNEIEPEHVRLRTMFLTEGIPLYDKVKSGDMLLLEEDEVIDEIRTLLRGLKGANTHVVSDHDHNLLMDVKGHVTHDADHLENTLNRFLDLPKETRESFIAARRSGHLRSLEAFLRDPEHPTRYLQAVKGLKEAGQGSLLQGMLATFSPRLF